MFLYSKLRRSGQIAPVGSPCRSHPTTQLIEQKLTTIKTTIAASSNPTEDIICSWLSQLADLYKYMVEYLNSSTARDSISSHQSMTWAKELLENSLNFLDVCGNLRDMVTEFKDHIINVHSTLRRRKFDFKCESGIQKYKSFRKRMKKDAKLLMTGLKQLDNNDEPVKVDSDDHQHAAVMLINKNMVTRVSETTVSVFESLLEYFSVWVSKPNRWSILVSKLIHKGRVACEDQQVHGNMNEIESIDDLLQTLCKNGSSVQEEKMQSVKSRLEKQENQLDIMETKLECIFRQLIGTRVSLLNIVSLL